MDLESLEEVHETPISETTKPQGNTVASILDSVKYFCSFALLAFCVVVIQALIFSQETVGTSEYNVPVVLAFIVSWFLIIWLAMMEGGQGCLVGLQPVPKESYAESHPITFKSTSLVHKGDNMERFIVGRQFLVVLVVFVTNIMAGAAKGADVLGLPNVLREIFINNGLAMILFTIMLGQLTAQVNGSNCMLDFINNRFMVFTTYVSLFIEISGLLHSVYLVQYLFAKVFGTPIETNEAPRTKIENFCFWGRVVFSLGALVLAFAVTLRALFDENTTMWSGIPPYVSVIIFFVLMCFVGLMEGMQIALFAVVMMQEDELVQHPTAYKNCRLTFSNNNLQAFLIGRQICVTICMFIVARITSIDIDENEPNIYGVPDGVQAFFNTGLLGAVITTIVASLAWRIVASSFPLAFLSNPLINPIIRLCLFMEATGICSASWIFARWQKLLFGLQPDEVHLEGADEHTSTPVTRRDKDIDRLVAVIKYMYSLIFLVFSVVIVQALIFSGETKATKDMGIPSVVAFFASWFLLFWLGMMEGGQGCLVGLQLVSKRLYSETHPITHVNTLIAHKGDNMDRFIVGRQFLVVLVVFLTNLMASAADKDANVLDLPDILRNIFISNGLAMILFTIMLGQLTAQVSAANCMLDFINNRFMTLTTYVSLLIEMSGLLHAVYLVQIIFAKITGNPIDSNESPRKGLKKASFWGRVIISFVILAFSFAVTLKALFEENTTMWDGVPSYVSVIVFLFLVCFVGLMEGMQIALFAVVMLPEEELIEYPRAHKNCQLTFKGNNLQAFLIGRQVCVTICMFIVARVTSLDIGDEEPNIYGVPNGLQEFFNTGLLGAVITTIVASLAWRIVASTYPLAFLSNPLIYGIIRLCLLLNHTGFCSAPFILARWYKDTFKIFPDEVYLKGIEVLSPRDKDIDITFNTIKYLGSLGLLIFSVTIVTSLIFTEQTVGTNVYNIPSIVAFLVFWFLLLWLATMEGGQGALVGLLPVNKEIFRETHPRTYANTCLVHKGDNMERFIIGRQFLVVLVVFMTNIMGSASQNADVLGLGSVTKEIFLSSGIAMVLTTIIIGQLTAQVNAANCMIDSINNWFMTFTTWVSLLIEISGLMHSVYLVQIIFSKITGKSIESNEPPRSIIYKVLFWIRVSLSLSILALAFAVTLKALFDENTTMWSGIPPYVSVIIFFGLMCFVGLMEGMQIALFAVVNLPEEELLRHKIAYENCKLTFSGNNLQAFLIGRQICVTLCMFVVARITSLDIDESEPNIYGVPDGVQEFFNTGLLGAVITTIVASLAWRIIASTFPLAFLSNPLIYIIIRLCLLLEATGVCSSAWLLALFQKSAAGYKLDECYYVKWENSDHNCVHEGGAEEP